MAYYHATEVESVTADSVTSTLRSDYHHHRIQDDNTSQTQQRVRFMCSFGGKILPRPHDNQLRYVGGDTRIVAVNRHTTFSSLLNKLSKLSGTTSTINIKYQLPNEDLDALITVTADEDVENMMEEFDRLSNNHKTARLRLFLFPTESDSRTSSISSLLDGSTRREHWFLDALNGRQGPGSVLERGRSEVSSIVSEVPDYLFGLDNSDDPPRESKLKNRNTVGENIPGSDPGSPDPVISSPFCSASSSLAPPPFPPIPDLPPVKTKPDKPVLIVESKEAQVEGVETGEPVAQQHTRFAGNPTWQYVSDSQYPGQPIQHIPIYYVPGPVQPGSVPVQQVPIGAPYLQPFPPPPGQVPVGFRQPVPGMGQVYGGGMRPATTMDPYDMSARVVPDAVNQPVYYGVRNGGLVPAYPGVVVQGGDEFQGPGTEAKLGRVSQS
ncbi:unnamed protein product [Ilex paraguariensis]|uniref:PB1 domain-containing protein n=1 Tax=Ilex paraguariensis TaxID=185542 RepID=A0ABC8UJR8_9AQUA